MTRLRLRTTSNLIWIISLFSCVLQNAQGAYPLNQTEEELLAPVRRNLGDFIEPEQAPETMQLLKTLFAEATSGQQLRIENDPLIESRYKEIHYKVFLVDSPLIEAYVYSPSEGGEQISRQFLIVTTGTLKKVYKHARSPEDASGLLLGIMSRELSRTINQLDLGNIGQEQYLQQRFIQAAILRGDIEGSLILNELGYDHTYVYRSILITEFIGDDESKALKTSRSRVKPHFKVRTNGSSAFLTIWRFLRGKLVDVNTPPVWSEKILLEIENLEIHSSIWTFQEPRSLLEALQRINRIDTENRDKPNNYNEVEFNRLLVRIDEFLESRSFNELTESEFEAFDIFIRRLVLNQSINS